MNIGRIVLWMVEYLGYLTLALFSITFVLKLYFGDFSKNENVNEILKTLLRWIKWKLSMGDPLTSEEKKELVEMRELFNEIQSRNEPAPSALTDEQVAELQERMRKLEETGRTREFEEKTASLKPSVSEESSSTAQVVPDSNTDTLANLALKSIILWLDLRKTTGQPVTSADYLVLDQFRMIFAELRKSAEPNNENFKLLQEILTKTNELFNRRF